MKRFGALSIAVMLAACGSKGSPTSPSSNTGPIAFTAQLSAANEVPPVTNAESNGRGTATITMNVTRDSSSGAVTGGGTIDFTVQLSGFPNGTQINAAHIHPGTAGNNGGVLISTGLTAGDSVILANGSGSFTKTGVTIDQTNAQNIASNPGGFYFNVHTTLNGGGAARGQLVRQ